MDSKYDVKEVTWLHPDSDPLMKMFNGYRCTLAVIPACELKMFDKIAAHPEGISASRLAEQHSWSASYTARLLDAQASFGLLKKTLGPDNIGIYHITESGKYMVSDFEGSFDGIFTLFSKVFQKSYSLIPELIKTGDEGDKAHWVLPELQINGSTDKQCPQDQSDCTGNKMGEGYQEKADKIRCAGQFAGRKPGENERRMYQIMVAQMYPYTDEIIHAFDLTRFKTVVDIGGGQGYLSFALSRGYPDMKITVMDMPHVIKFVREEFRPHDFDKLNVNYLEGDCLKDPIPVASLYIFCKVLHHFTEEKIEYVMNKLHEKLPPGGAVLILEDTLSPTRDGPPPSHCFDLMIMARKVGKDRTFPEFSSTLERCGFTTIKCIRTNPECIYDMIMAIKD